LNLSSVPIVKLDLAREVRSDAIRGKVVAIIAPDDPSERHEQYGRLIKLRKTLETAKSAIVLNFAPDVEPEISVGSGLPRLGGPNG